MFTMSGEKSGGVWMIDLVDFIMSKLGVVGKAELTRHCYLVQRSGLIKI